MNAHHKSINKLTSKINSISYFSSGSTTNSTPNQASSANVVHTDPILKVSSKLPFGWQVDAVIPNFGVQSLPTELEAIIVKELGHFYHVQAINLSDLLEVSFLNDYIRQGSLIALSVEEGEDDVVCIDGRGRIVLSVCKDTYELLGIPGRPSNFGSINQRYVIEINLKDPAFKTGKNGFNKIKTNLKNWPIQTDLFTDLSNPSDTITGDGRGKTFKMLFAFRDSNNKPSSISFPTSVTSILHLPTYTHSTIIPLTPFPTSTISLKSPPIPKLSSKRIKTSKDSITTITTLFDEESDIFNEWKEGLDEIREWFGSVSLGLESRRDETEEINLKDASWRGSWNGFFHPNTLTTSIINQLDNPTLEPLYISLSIQPPPFSPLSHLSKTFTPPTRKRSNGTKKKRGRGKGEEEEGDIEGGENELGMNLILGFSGKDVEGKGQEKEVEGMVKKETVEFVCWAGHK